jgi:hypothetical protein
MAVSCAREEAGKVGNRIVAILVATAITVALEYWWLDLSVVWVPLGAFEYLCVRYIGYFMRERRYIKNAMDEALRRSKGDVR